ncbi:hypothetical protein NDN08_002472 [Rhodosorus marinus]|uniref:Protein-tyrosine-phosphatase n=1 Tax=Rhodosorus marinus TaxID=101924 RepID=A0AAV8UWM2_9RHOD|nr:hypothetical protein NDN08_002472 [Rhodosorus marinus]
MGVGISKVLPNLFVGGEEIIVMESYSFFAENNVTHVLSLCDSSVPDCLPLTTLHLDMVDSPDYDIAVHFPKVVDFIHSARTKNEGIFVHCKAGVSRSATVIIAYIMSALNLSTKASFEHVKRCRSKIAPNDGFMRQLILFGREYSEELHKCLKERYEYKDLLIMDKKYVKALERKCASNGTVSNDTKVPRRTEVSVGMSSKNQD